MSVDISKMTREQFINQLPTIVRSLEAVRSGSNDQKPVDITLNEYIQNTYSLSREAYFEKIGVNPRILTMENIYSMPDQSIRWIVPEIIREAITLGIRQAPFYPNIISSDQPISGLQAIMPSINMSDAAPAKVNEAETIPLGDVSFGQKSVRLFKIGKGFKITDEVKNYVSLDILGIYLRDFGVQLGYALDDLALNVLLNGNKPDGSESAPFIGVATANTLTYKDMLRIWVRAARMGRNFNTMIGSENLALDMLDLPEFKNKQAGTTQATLTIKSPVPTDASLYIHSGTPANSTVMVDTSAALIKLTAKQLMLESERIVSNQTEATYASLTTGFSKMYQDACVVLDKSKAFGTYGFPDFMDFDPYISANIE